MQRWGLVTTIGGLSTLLALAGTSPPANAADPVFLVSVQKDESIVVVEGLAAGDPVVVDVKRNGVEIGRATGLVPTSGLFELNHRLDPETDQAVCWTDRTPDILGGDVVSVTAPGLVDSFVITDIDVTVEPTKVDADTGIVRGRISADPLPPIDQLKVTTSGRTALDQRFDGIAPGISNGVTGRLKYTAPGRFQATFDGLSPLQMGAFLDSEDVNATHTSLVGTAALSTVATHAADARFIEDLCPAVERRAVVGTSQGAINRTSIDKPLRVWGVSADASAVRVRVADSKGGHRTWPATLAGTGTSQTWSVVCPAGSLRRLADGTLTISATYSEGVGQTLTGAVRTIRKDTVTPAGPRIRPGGGTFLRSETVRLRSPGAGEIWYTLNGSRPLRNRSTEYHGEFRLTRSATVRAIAFDAAGNASPVTTAGFRRAGTPAAPRIRAAASGSPGGQATATARWRPRANSGGRPITGFAVTALRFEGGRVVDSKTFQRPARARSFTAQLVRNARIRFQVRTITTAGRSAPSARSNLVTVR